MRTRLRSTTAGTAALVATRFFPRPELSILSRRTEQDKMGVSAALFMPVVRALGGAVAWGENSARFVGRVFSCLSGKTS